MNVSNGLGNANIYETFLKGADFKPIDYESAVQKIIMDIAAGRLDFVMSVPLCGGPQASGLGKVGHLWGLAPVGVDLKL